MVQFLFLNWIIGSNGLVTFDTRAECCQALRSGVRDNCMRTHDACDFPQDVKILVFQFLSLVPEKYRKAKTNYGTPPEDYGQTF